MRCLLFQIELMRKGSEQKRLGTSPYLCSEGVSQARAPIHERPVAVKGDARSVTTFSSDSSLFAMLPVCAA